MFCFEICIPEGRGGEKEGSANFKTKCTEPLTKKYLEPCTYFCTDADSLTSDAHDRAQVVSTACY